LGGKILADVVAGRTFDNLVGVEAHNGRTWRQSTAERQSATCSANYEPVNVGHRVIVPKVALVSLFHCTTIGETKAKIKHAAATAEAVSLAGLGRKHPIMLEHRALAAHGSVIGTGIKNPRPDLPLDLSKYATAELKLVVDLDHYAVRDEAYRRSGRIVKRLATAEKRVADLQQELKDCGLAIDAASKQATAEQIATPTQ
jgi:hypothetical protein